MIPFFFSSTPLCFSAEMVRRGGCLHAFMGVRLGVSPWTTEYVGGVVCYLHFAADIDHSDLLASNEYAQLIEHHVVAT